MMEQGTGDTGEQQVQVAEVRRQKVDSVSSPKQRVGLRRALSSTGRMVESTVKQYLPNLTHSISIYELERGDHIYAYRAAGLYSHHGIYIGDFQVIHFNGEPGTSMLNMQAKITCDALDDFLVDSSLRRYRYSVSSEEYFMKRKGTCCRLDSDHPDSVIARARNCLENQGIPRYNVLKFNCEHFALYCKLGNRILELGDGWLGQLQEIISLPLFPIKAVGAVFALWDTRQKSNATANELAAPIEERFINISEASTGENDEGDRNKCTEIITSTSYRSCLLPLGTDDDNDEITFIPEVTTNKRPSRNLIELTTETATTACGSSAAVHIVDHTQVEKKARLDNPDGDENKQINNRL